MITRKDLQLLAEAIATIKDTEERERTTLLIGDVCHVINPYFHWDKWCDACRVENR